MVLPAYIVHELNDGSKTGSQFDRICQSHEEMRARLKAIADMCVQATELCLAVDPVAIVKTAAGVLP